jgi:hypothetical protein
MDIFEEKLEKLTKHLNRYGSLGDVQNAALSGMTRSPL